MDMFSGSCKDHLTIYIQEVKSAIRCNGGPGGVVMVPLMIWFGKRSCYAHTREGERELGKKKKK